MLRNHSMRRTLVREQLCSAIYSDQILRQNNTHARDAHRKTQACTPGLSLHHRRTKGKAKRPIIVLRHFMLIQKRAGNAC